MKPRLSLLQFLAYVFSYLSHLFNQSFIFWNHQRIHFSSYNVSWDHTFPTVGHFLNHFAATIGLIFISKKLCEENGSHESQRWSWFSHSKALIWYHADLVQSHCGPYVHNHPVIYLIYMRQYSYDCNIKLQSHQ